MAITDDLCLHVIVCATMFVLSSVLSCRVCALQLFMMIRTTTTMMVMIMMMCLVSRLVRVFFHDDDER